MAQIKVIDVNVDVTHHLHALRVAGVESIFAYLNPLGSNEKAITPARARAIRDAGLRLGLVSEGWGDFAHHGISASAGLRDAKHALRMAPTLGVTGEATIYFAVDTDATWGQIISLVIPYFKAIHEHIGGLRVGCYGSGAVCETLLQQQLVERAWLAQSRGWLRSREFALTDKWALKQLMPSHIAGVSCDPNVAQSVVSGTNPVAYEIGDFVPFGAPVAPDTPVASADVPRDT
jgi:hypothetical protein